jgi:integrase
MIDGELTAVHPHDLRRTYARRCYDAGMDILAIRDNLGHADHKTTLAYIGVQEMDTRKPPALFSPPHWAELETLEVQGRIVESEGSE